MYETNDTDISYSDLMDRLPYCSSRYNEYTIVAYYYDANAVLVELLKNRQTGSLTTAWKILNENFKKSGIQLKIYIMDNECSEEKNNHKQGKVQRIG